MKNIKMSFLQSTITLVVIFAATTLLFLYTSGYRLVKEGEKKIDLKKTGMISAKSIPEGASVYLDGLLITATNDTISGINPGMHDLKITKSGFVEWSKKIEVFPQLVTDITAILISQTPRLEPLTNTGAKYPSVSPTLTKLAYFSKEPKTPGIFIIPLTQGALSIFRSNPYLTIKDTMLIKYSDGESIEWSPDEKNLLIKEKNSYYLVDLLKNTAETTSSPDLIRNQWTKELGTKRAAFLEKLDITDDVKTLASSSKSLWSPDDKKFIYTIQKGDVLRYHVYNLEKPLPVGEKVDSTVLVIDAKERQPVITWYYDSFHLILVEGDIEKERKGVISMIRIDGTNKLEIYNNTLSSDLVYSVPSGDKFVILTSFKSGSQTDLYTIGIR